MRNPLSLILYGFLSKWYLIISISAILVVYWVYNGLKNTGVIDKAELIILKGLEDCKSVAQNCVPHMTDIQQFWTCLNNLPAYRPINKEDLENIRQQPINSQTNNEEIERLKNPYESNKH